MTRIGRTWLEAQGLGRVTSENPSAAFEIGDNRSAEITISAIVASRLFPLGEARDVAVSELQSLMGP